MSLNAQNNQLTAEEALNQEQRKRRLDYQEDYYSSNCLKIAKVEDDNAHLTELHAKNMVPPLMPAHMAQQGSLPMFAAPSTFNSAMLFPFGGGHPQFFQTVPAQHHQLQHTPPTGNGVFNNSKDSGVESEAIGSDRESPTEDLGSPESPTNEEVDENEPPAEQKHFSNVTPLRYSLMPGDPGTFAPGPYNLEDVYTQVPARTALLAASTKHKVTVGEILRRINPPECLHASLINGILRKAKAKDGGKTLRTSLGGYGIFLPQGRRKTAPATSFTALCEEEAVGMARDFHMLCEDFNASDVGSFLTQRTMNDRAAAERQKQQLHFVRLFLDEMSMIIQSAGAHPRDYEKQKNTLGEATCAVQSFGLLTHGFGPNALLASIQVLRNVAMKSLENIETNQPSQAMPLNPKNVSLMNMPQQQMMSSFSNIPPGSFPVPGTSFMPPNVVPGQLHHQFQPYFYRNDHQSGSS